MNIKTKECTRCHQIKPLSEFWSSKRTNDRLRYTCKDCVNKYMKTYYLETGAGRYRRLAENARRDKVKVSISKQEFIQWLNSQSKICFYCGTPLQVVYGHHWQWDGLTIDRFDPNNGYGIDNICLACRRCNIIKGHWFTKEQMLEIAQKYLRD